MSVSENARGSLWNRWDPHIHAPGTVLNDQFGGTEPWEEFFSRVEAATPAIRALGITDYLNLECYEKVRAHKAAGRLDGVELIFPNVEMRFGIETAKGSPINVHLLISPEDPDHVEQAKRFLRSLEFGYRDERYRCEPADLIRLGKAHDPSITDDRRALKVGTNQFKVDFDALRQAYAESRWALDNILIAVAGGGKDGTAGLSADASFAALRKEIERSAKVIFSAQPQQREFWLGRGPATPEQLRTIWGGCKPCLHGSDAHEHEKVGVPDLDRMCWLKGDVVFETLRQACIEPEGRSFVGGAPPRGALASQVVADARVSNAPWLSPEPVPLNPGLVAIIGARGSGKTALADLIAAGAFATSPHLNERSFIRRAADHLAHSAAILAWESGDTTQLELMDVDVADIYDSPRVQYLSQQFVDQLCSSEGVTDELLAEVERVIFQAHPPEDRMGTTSFRELLELRAAPARAARGRHEAALVESGTALTAERARKASLPALVKQREQKFELVKKDKADRAALLGKGDDGRAKRLEELSSALDAARARVERAKVRGRALLALREEVRDLRGRSLPAHISGMRERHANAALEEAQWEAFALTFAGDVDAVLAGGVANAEREVQRLTGTAIVAPQPGTPAAATPLIATDADLAAQPLALIEAEVARLRHLVGLDAENMRKLARLSEKITREDAELVKLDRAIESARKADERIAELLDRRRQAYADVFDALLQEERELSDLYAPLRANLEAQEGTLGKLSFTVRRVVDVEAWAQAGEALLDLRKGGPFKGRGTLLQEARRSLGAAWEAGSASDVADAMARFREQHEKSLIEHAPVERSDAAAFRNWANQVAGWLYGTDHVRVSYGVHYDGVPIEQLSPGTRGIVLLLLYLAIDGEDDRPLIIDQPEENLDPKSIFDELVDRFRQAKLRRQIIIVTHNANLVINTDVDQVIVATCGPHRPGELPEISYDSGGLENARIRAKVCEILEGGEAAFRERARRLRVRF